MQTKTQTHTGDKELISCKYVQTQINNEIYTQKWSSDGHCFMQTKTQTQTGDKELISCKSVQRQIHNQMQTQIQIQTSPPTSNTNTNCCCHVSCVGFNISSLYKSYTQCMKTWCSFTHGTT